MSSFIKVITGADTAPIAISDALRHLRALENDSDMVWTYLQAATALVEDYTSRSLVSKTFDLYLPEWPVGMVELRRTPLVSVTHVKYYASGATVQSTLSTDDWRSFTGREPGMLEFTPTFDAPGLETRQDAVEIRFVAGYGTKSSAMPAALRTAILMLTHYWFDERKPIADAKAVVELPFSVRHLLRAFRVDSQFAIP